VRTKAISLILACSLACGGCTASWRIMGVDMNPKFLTAAVPGAQTADNRVQAPEHDRYPVVILVIVGLAMGFGVYAASE
jgi:hypothetical protein